MSNEKTAQGANTEVSMLQAFGNAPAQVLDAKALFDTAELSGSEMWDTVSGDYYKFQDGETVLLLLNGISQMESNLEENKGEFVDVAELEDRNGNKFINGDVVMVSTARKLVERGLTPCLIRVFCNGKKGTGRKQYLNLEIARFATSK